MTGSPASRDRGKPLTNTPRSSGPVFGVRFIERLWKFIKRRALYGRYHPTFADFQATIQDTLDGLSTTHAEDLKTLMTLNFQQFEDVSLMTA